MSEKKGFVRLPLCNDMLKPGREQDLIKLPNKDDIVSEQSAAMHEFGEFTFFDITGGSLPLKDPADAKVLLELAFKQPGQTLDKLITTFTDDKCTGQQMLQLRLMAGLALITQTISAVRNESHPLETLAYIKTFLDMAMTSMIVGVGKDIDDIQKDGNASNVIDSLSNIIDDTPPSPVMMLHFIEACRAASGIKGGGPGLHKMVLNADDYKDLSEPECEKLDIIKAGELVDDIKRNGGPELDMLEVAKAIKESRIKGISSMLVNKNGNNSNNPPTNKESRRDLN